MGARLGATIAGADSQPTLLRVERISKTFPGQRALDRVSMEIAPREIHALVGENGSGKSTLIKVLAGFHAPDPGGHISVDGEALRPANAGDVRRLGLRFVHQDLGLVSELSAAENFGLAYGFAKGSLRRIAWRAQRRTAQQLLARIGVEIDVALPVADLRPVERSAVAIARALAEGEGRIRLLVLDEPTAALPPAETQALFRVLREVVEGGVSILYVSHRLDEILGLAARVTVLRDGACEGTFPVEGMDRQRLARLIVGDEVELTQDGVASRPAVAPDGPATAHAGPPAMRVRGLAAEHLRGVDFEVGRGEVLGIAGLSGSGREELAGAVCGASPARLTVVDAHGREWHGMTPKRARQLGLALVLANRHPSSAIGQFTIRENVTLTRLPAFSRAGRVVRERERSSVLEWIGEIDIRPRDPERLYEYLSGGNKQKVILAKWLSTRPTLLVMDDPTSGVDIGARHAIYRLVRAQAAEGAAVLVCSSDLEDFVGVCDRVLALRRGRIAQELRGAEIQESRLLHAIVGAASDAAEPRTQERIA